MPMRCKGRLTRRQCILDRGHKGAHEVAAKPVRVVTCCSCGNVVSSVSDAGECPECQQGWFGGEDVRP